MSRPSSSQSVPFTPRIPKSKKGIRANKDDKAYDELIDNIASARKVPRSQVLEEFEDNEAGDSSFHSPSTNFHHRPLASRVTSSSGAGAAAAGSGVGGSRLSSGGRRKSRDINNNSGGLDLEAGDDLDDTDALGDEEEEQEEEELPPKKVLEGVPLVVQEAWLCEDLGYVLQGIQGELIKFAKGYDPMDESARLKGAEWVIDGGLDPSLLKVIERLLPMATSYTAIDGFVEVRNDTTYGRVNHALVSGMRGILKDYQILTNRLESLYLTSPSFTLQTVFLHLHPTLHVLSLLYSLCQALDFELPDSDDESSESSDDGLMPFMKIGARKAKRDDPTRKNVIGGEVLGVLVERGASMGGDPTATSLYSTLLLHASQPYARMILTWVSSGNLSDPHNEFMVQASALIDKGRLEWDTTDDYWDRRYTLRDGSSLASLSAVATLPSKRPGTNRLAGGGCIPAFLEPWKKKILLSGKYLNVIKECGIEVAEWEKERDAESAGVETAAPLEVEQVVASGPEENQPQSSGTPIPKLPQSTSQSKLRVKTKLELSVSSDKGRILTPPVTPAQWDHRGDVDGMIKMDSPKFFRHIDEAYIYANKKLLKLLLEEQELVPHLRSMKHFFFLDQSEFLDQFLDNAGSELRKTAQSASMTKMQSLLYMAVSNPASASSLDPYKEDLRITLATEGLFDYLIRITDSETNLGLTSGDAIRKTDSKKGELLAIDALQFDLAIKFPLNLVISRKTQNRYQLIFRFLLGLRYLEFSLTNMWLDQKSTIWKKQSGDRDLERWKLHVFRLRSHMLQWVQHVLGFATTDVLEVNWKKLEEKLSKVQTVDQLLKDHADYLSTCMRECTLSVEKTLMTTSKILSTINTFAAYGPQLNKALGKYYADPHTESQPAQSQLRWNAVRKFESHFKHHVVTHYDVVQYIASSDTPAMLALAARLTELRKAIDD